MRFTNRVRRKHLRIRGQMIGIPRILMIDNSRIDKRGSGAMHAFPCTWRVFLAPARL